MALRFGDFELDPTALELSSGGQVLPLAPQPTTVLAYLVENAGRTVSREEIQRHVWGNDHVEADLGLNSCIRKIRAQLGDDAAEPRFIQTLPRRGYRFVAPVDVGSEPELSAKLGARSKWLWIAAAVIAAGSLWFWLAGRHPAEDPRQIAVAILPFDNLTGDPAQRYVSDGLTEETIASLGRIGPSRLAVIARTTAMQLETDNRDIVSLARELDVGYLVEGSVRRDNGRLRATARLIDGATGLQTGSETWEATADDLLRAQATLADHLAGWLAGELLPGSTVFDDPGVAVDPDLYETYLQGLHRLQEGSADGYRAARERFELVVAGAPDFALGWSGLAEAWLWQRWFGSDSPDQALAEARGAAERAISLAPELANPQLLLGYAALYVDFDLVEAGRRLERAVELEPGSARAQSWFAAYLSAIGDHDQAIARAELARRLDPLAMAVAADLCWLQNYARRFEDARRACTSALDLKPDDIWITLGRIEALRQLGLHAEAVAAVAGLARRSDATGADEWIAIARHDPAAALERAFEWLQTVADRQPQPYFAASVAALRGREDRALEQLDAAWRTRSMLLVFVGVDPRFDSVRSTARFQDLIARLGLPAEPARFG